MAERYKKLKDEEVATLVDALIRQSTGYHDNRLTQERTEVLDYYDGKKPKRLHKGSSSYVSTDVYDGVEQMKAQILETFASGHRIVQFAPENAEDTELARVATELCDWAIFRQNSGYDIFQDIIQDGLMNRAGVVKVWWEEKSESSTESFPEPLMGEEVAFLEASGDFESVEAEEDEDGLFAVTVTRTVDRSQVRLMPLPPEQFVISDGARSIQDAPLVAHRQRLSRSDLLKQGYAPGLIDKVGGESDTGWETDEEFLARHENAMPGSEDMEHVQDQAKRVWVYEAYVDLDIDGDGRTELWKITKAGNVLLDKERVSRKPFVAFVPLRRPHTFWGGNWAERIIGAQKAKTTLVRSILDHTVITTNPRWQVVKGALRDPREMMENRLGGLVNVDRPDGIIPLPQNPLNPFVFQTLSYLDYDLEDTSGISRLSQGLNKDAVSKQNSAALVEELSNASQTRQKIIARNFAKGFLVPLYLLVYEILIENLERPQAIEVAGQWVEVSVEDWKSRRDVSVELHLGYGEQDREAQMWLMLDQLFSQDPQTQPLYTIDKKWAVLKKALELKGVKNIEDYLTPPDQAQQPEPDPMAVAQIQMEQQKLQLDAQRVQIEMMRAQADVQDKLTKSEIDAFKARADHALKSDQMDLEEKEFLHDREVDLAEIEQMKKAASDKKNVIVSPNS